MAETDFSTKHVVGFAFCSSPPALLMLVVSSECLSCLLNCLEIDANLQVWHLGSPVSLTYLVTPFSFSLVISHPCPQHCWTKVPPFPQGKSCWVRVESLWEGEPRAWLFHPALLGKRTSSPPVTTLMLKPVLCR